MDLSVADQTCNYSFELSFQTNELSLHIPVVGQWTNKLYEYFEAEQRRLQITMQGEFCEVGQHTSPCVHIYKIT